MQVTDLFVSDARACAAALTPAGAGAVQVAAEHSLKVLVNGREAMRVTCTPAHLADLVIGRLLSGGLAASPEEILEVTVSADGACASVTLSPEAAAGLRPSRVEAVRTSWTEAGATLSPAEAALPRVRSIPWRETWIRQLGDRLQEGAPLYSLTHAVHACYLARGERLLCCREDLGRHNALDKVIGWAAREGTDLRQCLLLTTGRLPTDMVEKAIRCGVPLLASKTYPTDRGVAAAREAGLTLVTLRPGGQLLVWTGSRGEPD